MPADAAKPPIPSSKRVRASRVSSSKSRSKSKSKVVEEEELVEVIEEAPRPVFETFETDVTLQDGLSIVRSLGGGKYEIINLMHVDPDAITSAETGAVIKADKKLLKAMDIDDLEWQVAKFKVNQAVGSASKFVPLPLTFVDCLHV
jgi:ATPase subunit of ABC transporter with duplicated ATPase domains